MMFGGSPMSVAVPPMLEAMISVMKNGTGLSSSILQTVKVTGPISNTVVTLSRNAERTAVIMQNNTMITHGLPFAIFAVRIAMYSNMPEFLTTATNIIMPTKTPSVPKSMCSMPVSKLRIPVRMSTTAPASAATVRWTFSEMISANTTMKITIEMICGVVNSGIYTTPNLTPFPEGTDLLSCGKHSPHNRCNKTKEGHWPPNEHRTSLIERVRLGHFSVNNAFI